MATILLFFCFLFFFLGEVFLVVLFVVVNLLGLRFRFLIEIVYLLISGEEHSAFCINGLF